MKHIGIHEAKTHLSELITQVTNGKEYIITKRGIPVARLCPTNTLNREEIKKTLEQAKELRKNLSLGGLKIKDLMNEGRR